MSRKSRDGGDRFEFIRNTKIFFGLDFTDETPSTEFKKEDEKPEERKNDVVPRKNRMNKHLQDLSSATTLHGLRQAVDNSAHVSRRVTWTFVIVVMIVCYAIGTFYSISKYLRFESRTRLSTVTVETLEFPAVTICPQNQVSRTSAERDPHLKHWMTRLESEGIEHLTEDERQEAQQVLGKHLLSDVFDSQLDDVILHCKFNTFEVACSDVFRPVLTEKSVCFTFMDSELISQRGMIESELPGSPFGLRT